MSDRYVRSTLLLLLSNLNPISRFSHYLFYDGMDPELQNGDFCVFCVCSASPPLQYQVDLH